MSCISSRSIAVCLLVLNAVAYVKALALEPTVFPLSTRQALAQRSTQINDPILTGVQRPAMGWSNRAATLVTPVNLSEQPCNNVYTADRPFLWNNIDVGCRATIIELPPSTSSGQPDLWVHSPVQLDGPLMQCVNSLGTVRYVCTPNYEHMKYASMWYQNYQNVNMWGCPGLRERLPDIPWTGEIPTGYRPKSWTGRVEPSSATSPAGMWDESILQSLHINVEKNPFTGRPFFNEVVFYHVPTKTLLTTDLFWNYPSDGVANSEFGRDDTWELAPRLDGVPLTSRLWKFGMDKVYYPFYTNLMVTDKAEYQAIAHHIVNVWDVETVIPAHGDILRGKEFIRSVLTRYFQLDS